jgi:FkbM family methyltransferase
VLDEATRSGWRAVVGSAARTFRPPIGRRQLQSLLHKHPGPCQIEFRDLNGMLRRADLTDEIECRWFLGGSMRVSKVAMATIRPGDWVVDAGANVGIMAGQLAKAVGPQGVVWAIEPLPRNVARLRELVADNRLAQLQVIDVAVGAKDEHAQLRLPRPGFSGWASFTATWNRAGVIDVAVRRLDALVDEMAPEQPLRFIKLDVEGFEFEFLEGARATLARYRPFVYAEFNDDLNRNRGRSSAELMLAFRELGYRPWGPQAALRDEDLAGTTHDILLAPEGGPPDPA